MEGGKQAGIGGVVVDFLSCFVVIFFVHADVVAQHVWVQRKTAQECGQYAFLLFGVALYLQNL